MTATFDVDAIASGESSALQAAATGTATAIPPVPTEFPDDVKKGLTSIYKAEIDVLTKYRNNAGAMPTGVWLAAGAAAGAMGYVAM